MIKSKYETKTYTKTERVLVSEKRYCDLCGKEITDHYYIVSTGHNDWGNDSCDSIEIKDLCSTECIQKEFKEYCERSDNKRNTWWFEIKHLSGAYVKGEIKYDD